MNGYLDKGELDKLYKHMYIKIETVKRYIHLINVII